jgi:hypothetical protein
MSMADKKWSELIKSRISFVAYEGGQMAYKMSSVDVSAINGITTRGPKNGRESYVGVLGDTGIDYYAPRDTAIAIDGDEISYSITSMAGGPVTFSRDSAGDYKFNGLRVRCSGYFSLTLDDFEGEINHVFTALDLTPENTASIGDNSRFYPPGAYIFYLDNSATITLDMQQRYVLKVDENKEPVYIDQIAGEHRLEIELMETPEPPIYLAWCNDAGEIVKALDPKNPVQEVVFFDPTKPKKDQPDRVDRDSLKPVDLVTVSGLHVILSSIFASADVDPTGEGTAYLPWKIEQWRLPGKMGKVPFNLEKAQIDAVNAANRTSKNGIENYAGVLLPMPVIKPTPQVPEPSQTPSLEVYCEKKVQFELLKVKKKATDPVDPTSSTSSTVAYELRIKLDKNAPEDLMFRLFPATIKDGGFRDISIQATGYFQILFHPPNQKDEQLQKKIVSADDGKTKTTLILVENENMDSTNSIYPPGTYLFRPYDLAGATITLLAKATIGGNVFTSDSGAFLSITSIKPLGGDEYYNVWFNPKGPEKIVNTTDPKDQPITLTGMKQVKPVLDKDIGPLFKPVYDSIASSVIWKTEQWKDAQGKSCYVAYLINGIVDAYKDDVEYTKEIDIVKASDYRDPDDPTDTKPTKIPANTLSMAEKKLTSLGYTRVQSVWKIEQCIDPTKKRDPNNPNKSNNSLYYVTYNVAGEMVNIINADDPKDTIQVGDPRKPDSSLKTPLDLGLRKVPTLIEEELKSPDETPENAAADMQNAIDLMERHTGYENLGDKGANFDIDWTDGKLKKMVFLTGTDNITINFKNPPRFSGDPPKGLPPKIPCMFELFIARSQNRPANAPDTWVRFTSSNIPFIGVPYDDKNDPIKQPVPPPPNLGPTKQYKPSPNEARELRFVYDGKKYYMEHLEFG